MSAGERIQLDPSLNSRFQALILEPCGVKLHAQLFGVEKTTGLTVLLAVATQDNLLDLDNASGAAQIELESRSAGGTDPAPFPNTEDFSMPIPRPPADPTADAGGVPKPDELLEQGFPPERPEFQPGPPFNPAIIADALHAAHEHGEVLKAASALSALQPETVTKYFRQLEEIGGAAIQGNFRQAALLLVQSAVTDLLDKHGG